MRKFIRKCVKFSRKCASFRTICASWAAKVCKNEQKLNKMKQKCACFEQKLTKMSAFWACFFDPLAQMRALLVLRPALSDLRRAYRVLRLLRIVVVGFWLVAGVRNSSFQISDFKF